MAKKTRLTFSGQTFEYDKVAIGSGGQGTVYKATLLGSAGTSAIIKELPSNTETHKRIEFWVRNGLGYQIPGLAAPLAQAGSATNSHLYVAPFSSGVSLEDDKPRSLPELLEIAILMVGVWVRLEQSGIAHGDIALSNFLVTPEGDIALIDIDNFSEASVPLPSMYGQHAFMAPEIRLARNKQSDCVKPTIESDRFAWAVLLSFWLLGRHPADIGENLAPSKFDEIMTRGQWPELKRIPQSGETPMAAVGPFLQSLFVNGFSKDTIRRPSAMDWYQGLWDTLECLYIHRCGGALILDPKINDCPWCGKRLSMDSLNQKISLSLTHVRSNKHYTTSLNTGQKVILGRNAFPHLSRYVSGEHAELVVEKDTLAIRQKGQNPTWIVLADGGKQQVLDRFKVTQQPSGNMQFVLCIADEVFRVVLSV